MRFQPAQNDPEPAAGSHDETCRDVVRHVLQMLGPEAYEATDGRDFNFGGVEVRLEIRVEPDEDLGDSLKKKARAVLHLPGEEGDWTPVHYHVYFDYVDK